MSRPCGCRTYEECWAGDCCCMTMADKLKWAEDNGITPPESAFRCDASMGSNSPCCEAKRKAPDCPLCENESSQRALPTSKTILTHFDLKCKGRSVESYSAIAAVPPPCPFIVAFDVTIGERLHPFDCVPLSIALPPDSPPPRS